MEPIPQIRILEPAELVSAALAILATSNGKFDYHEGIVYYPPQNEPARQAAQVLLNILNQHAYTYADNKAAARTYIVAGFMREPIWNS